LAESIDRKYGVKAKLIESGGGAFEVRKDGKLVFSKKATGRFPDNKELFKAIDK